jgi:signal transduction histidine kinase
MAGAPQSFAIGGPGRLSVTVVIGVTALLVVALLPIADHPGPVVPGLISLFAAVIFVTELSTSFLLLVRFRAIRTWSLLLLSCAFFYSGLMTIPYLLTFPGAVLAERPLLGASLQSTSWAYILWIDGFALLSLISVTIEAWFGEHRIATQNVRDAIVLGLCLTAIFTLALLFAAIVTPDRLPALVSGQRFTELSQLESSLAVVLFAASIAIIVLAVGEQNRIFLWFALALTGMAFANILATAGGGRFNIGWSIGRLSWLMSACVLFIYLLVLHARDQELLRDSAEQLAQSNMMLERERDNKLMNLEAMVASIAHEVRQPLTAIAATGAAALEFLGLVPPDLEEARSDLNTMITESHRASQVFDNIRALFGRASKRSEPVDVNEVALEVLRTLGGELKDHGITTRTDLMSELPLVMGHRGQLQEVLLNLIRNAIEAMGAIKDGRRVLQVRTECHDDRDEIVVAVENSGPGIDPKKLDGIFDPFVSTKPQGMGLGLAICRMIIDRHGGQLSAWSGKKRGAVFQFILPTQSIDKDAVRPK